MRIKKMDSGERRVEGPNRCLHWRQRKKEMRKAGEWRGGSRQQRGDGENQQDLKKEQMEMEGCKKEEFIKEDTGLSLEQGLQNQIPTEPSKYHKWAKWVRYKTVGSHGVCSKLGVHVPSKEGTYCSCESMGSQCGQLPGLRRKISSKFKFLYKNLLVFKCWELIQILKRKKTLCWPKDTHLKAGFGLWAASSCLLISLDPNSCSLLNNTLCSRASYFTFQVPGSFLFPLI